MRLILGQEGRRSEAVERGTSSTLLVHLPRMEGWGERRPYVKNRPSLGRYGAVAMNAALVVDDQLA